MPRRLHIGLKPFKYGWIDQPFYKLISSRLSENLEPFVHIYHVSYYEVIATKMFCWLRSQLKDSDFFP